MKKQNKILINGTISLAMVVASISTLNNNFGDKVQAKTADELGKEIEALQAQIDSAEKRAQEFRNKTQTLQSELEGIAREKTTIENQIKISQAQYDKLQIEIQETEKNIKNNRRALGGILAQMSLEDEISPIEQIAGSKNLSNALDSFEYKSAIKTSLVEKVNEIKAAKKRLEEKRDEIKVVLENQKNSEKALQAKIQEQNQLIAKTQGQEAEYSKYAQERGEQKRKKQQEQQAAIEEAIRRAAANSGGGGMVNLGGTSAGYPWTEANCYVDANAWSYGGLDGNGSDGLGYFCRQCVSYTAWRLMAEKGIKALYWGNANMWPASARRAGFATGTTPRPGSIGVISAGVYGHVVWVESVEGNYVTVAQYNANVGGQGWGKFSRVRVPAQTYDTYIYF